MLYVFCALYGEAKPFIEKYELERDMSFSHYQVFGNADMILTITGVGVLPAAMAVTEVCTRIPPVSCDYLLNAGICGSIDSDVTAGDVFLVNKISDDVTKKEYYPDIIYKTGIPEKALCAVTVPGYVEGALTDMESSGVYAAGERFFSAERMVFLKAVSDMGDTENAPRELKERCADTLLEKAQVFINEALEQSRRGIKDSLEQGKREVGEADLKEETESLAEKIEKLAEDLRLSATMNAGLKQLLRYMSIEGGDVRGLIERIYEEEELPVKVKSKGKRIYDGIYETIFSHIR